MTKQGILVTGGSGLLALNWAVAMRDRCNVVLGTHARQVALSGVVAQPIDLESPDELSRAIESSQATAVIHTAGLTNVDACEANPQLAQHINVDLAVNVAHACARSGVAMVHISTDHLFAGDDCKVNEEAPVSPINVYGRTKAEAEVRVLQTNPATIVARTNFYGWGPTYRRSFSDVILNALRDKRSVTLFDDVHYTPIVMQELVRAAHELLDRRASGIFNVVGDERLSKHQFGLRLAACFGLDPASIKAGKLAEHKSLVQRPREMSLSNKKLSNLLCRKIGAVDEQLQLLLEQARSSAIREVQIL